MRRAFSLCLLLSQVSVAWAAGAGSDVVSVPRPKGPEFMGLYLMGKKVGYLSTDVALKGGQIEATNEMHFKANVGPRTSERHMKDTRLYEAKPNGRLLKFTVEQSGDGGDQTLIGTCTEGGCEIVRKRPKVADERLKVPASKEVAEDADQARVALKRNAKVVGTITDGLDLEQYKVTTTVGETSTKMFLGVQVKVHKVVTLSEKEKVPTESLLDDKGRMLEVQFGPTMTAVAEPEDQAKRLDTVEVFGLTRVVLPKALPNPRAVPGKTKLVLQGLPEKFRHETYRQKYRALPNDQVEVTLLAAAPTKHAPRPLVDPNGGTNLKSTIIVEADHPEIVATAKKIVGAEKDSWAAAKKVSRWVHDHMTADYGASADRSTDVLRTMRGDCTEHSLLTVALLRASGIPARRVDGVIYIQQDDGVPAFYWHEWVEAYVGEWTQLDPTFDEDVADASHFGLGEEGSAEITPLFGTLKVVDDE
jgi:hypothetical protein